MTQRVLTFVATGILAAMSAYAQQTNPADVFERVRPSIVRIESFGGRGGDALGTGFVVSADGVIATNWHVVEDAKSLRVRLDTGDTFDDVGLVDSDQRRDLAILKIKAVGLRPVILANSDDVKPGQRILRIGHSAGLESTITEGLVSGVRRADDVPELQSSGYQVFQISSPIWHGASGGVVLNEAGEVIAVPFAGLTHGQNINFAIPAKYVAPLVSSNVRSSFGTATQRSADAPVPSRASSVLSAIEPAVPPAELLTAKRVFVGYVSGHRAVFENLPKKLREMKRWTLVSDEKDADFLLLFYQSGTSSLGGDQLTLAAVSKTGRKMLSVNCERRMSSGYTAGVLVNRMKKRLADADREQK